MNIDSSPCAVVTGAASWLGAGTVAALALQFIGNRMLNGETIRLDGAIRIGMK